MNRSPQLQYQHDLSEREFVADPTQAAAIAVLDELYQQLVKLSRKKWRKVLPLKHTLKGCYLWGSVGTGKSYLMNTFFQTLPFKNKLRLHFHEFMRRVHHDLNNLKGQADPLKIVAKKWSENRVLCFDEFFVTNIADAMLLQNLLSALFAQGVVLVATSNVPPADLYRNGLQRERFMPCIELLQERLTVLSVDNQQDYRRLHLKPAQVYFTPDNATARGQMNDAFEYYAKAELVSDEPRVFNDREFAVIRHASSVIWFDFAELCVKARGTEDYLAIAETYPIVMVSHIPVIPENDRNTIVRFIHLIDVLYDKGNIFIASGAAPVEELYTGTSLAFEFRRTKSRLLEMQSLRV
jgi:cell division protein ZapE